MNTFTVTLSDKQIADAICENDGIAILAILANKNSNIVKELANSYSGSRHEFKVIAFLRDLANEIERLDNEMKGE